MVRLAASVSAAAALQLSSSGCRQHDLGPDTGPYMEGRRGRGSTDVPFLHLGPPSLSAPRKLHISTRHSDWTRQLFRYPGSLCAVYDPSHSLPPITLLVSWTQWAGSRVRAVGIPS